MRFTSLRAVEFGLGIVLVVTPLLLAVTDLLDARAAATLVAAALGIALVTLGVATTREGTAMEPSSHAALDRILVVLLVVAGIVLAVTGDVGVGGICIAAGLILGIVASGTRYEETPADAADGATTSTTS